MHHAYPLLTEPIYKAKVWGGRAFEQLGRELPWPAPMGVGESWEVADLASTARSGGGGGSARSVIANGRFAGETLGALLTDDPRAVLGAAAPCDAFPLLVKLLDAHENVSVQVHPSPAYAASHPGAHLKSEAWYVIDAEPGAVIYAGVPVGTTPSDLLRAVEEGSVHELLLTVPAEPGACYYLPTGTCHALGAGVLIAEVQTPSDTTFRIFDWGREGRELHVDAALQSMTFGPLERHRATDGSTHDASAAGVRPLVRCEHFAIEEWSPSGRVEVEVTTPEVWMALGGGSRIDSPASAFDALELPPWRTVVLPAAVGSVGATLDDGAKLLRVRVPEGPEPD